MLWIALGLIAVEVAYLLGYRAGLAKASDLADIRRYEAHQRQRKGLG